LKTHQTMTQYTLFIPKYNFDLETWKNVVTKGGKPGLLYDGF
jgi:hypothetical protein